MAPALSHNSVQPSNAHENLTLVEESVSPLGEESVRAPGWPATHATMVLFSLALPAREPSFACTYHVNVVLPTLSVGSVTVADAADSVCVEPPTART